MSGDPEPFGLREMLLDAAEQTEEWNRDQRAEYLDAAAGGTWDPHDDADYPSGSDLAQMTAWDRLAEREAGR